MSASPDAKRLAYLAVEAPTVGQAAHVHVKEIVAGLTRRGWSVRMLKPYYTDAAQKPGALGRLVESFAIQSRLWLGRTRGEAIYVRSHFLAFPTAVLARMLGIRIVHEVNGTYADVYVTHPWLAKFRWIIDAIWRVQFRWADLILPVTEELADWLAVEAGHKRIAVVPNGANTELFSPDASPDPGIPQKAYAVFFGGLARWHGVDVMLDAVASPYWPADVDLVIVGDGQERPRVEAAARENSKIVVRGYQPYERIASFVAPALCSLVIISDPRGRSRTGVLPLKLFEAMACGVPVIVTDLPGQADLVRASDCGLVVDVDDADAVAMAVGELSRNRPRAKDMGLRGLLTVRAEHSWDARAGRVDELLASTKRPLSKSEAASG